MPLFFGGLAGVTCSAPVADIVSILCQTNRCEIAQRVGWLPTCESPQMMSKICLLHSRGTIGRI